MNTLFICLLSKQWSWQRNTNLISTLTGNPVELMKVTTELKDQLHIASKEALSLLIILICFGWKHLPLI